MGRWDRVLSEITTTGAGPTLRRVVSGRLRRAGLIESNDADQRRLQLSRELDCQLESTVRYGPFRGFRMHAESWWGQSDRAAMLFGLYEQEVIRALGEVASGRDTLIDLGAADGFFGVGALVGGLFKRSVCYEMSTLGRQSILRNAAANGVQDCVDIRGLATRGFQNDFTQEARDDCVMVIDIEGAEFDLLDQTTFRSFQRSPIIIELHDWLYEDGSVRLAKLKAAATETHSISEMTTGARDLSLMPELRALSDTDRWLICSEGRARMMTWLRLDPLKSGQI